MNQNTENILIIKLGALGDIIQALGPMATIRQFHPNAHIILLTSTTYKDLLLASGYVDEIWLDSKPKWFQIGQWLKFRRQIKKANFRRVYDLQTSDRSNSCHHILWPGPYPEWSGIAKGCSHPHANIDRNNMHTIERQADQLLFAGINKTLAPDLSWADSDTNRFNLVEPHCLLVPGGAAHRPEKRWPVERYIRLTHTLSSAGVTPVLLGESPEIDLLSIISDANPRVHNLAGKTTLLDLASLARRAIAAVGNDTGPMHLLSAAGCPSTVLFSADSNPDLCAPRGPAVNVVQSINLSALSVAQVLMAMKRISPSLQTLTIDSQIFDPT